MKFTIEDLQNKRKKAIKVRVRSKVLSSKMIGSKPRNTEEKIVLNRVTINRVKKAIHKGLWDTSRLKSERRIVFHG